MRYLQLGPVDDSSFTEWTPTLGIDNWFYLIYQDMQSGRIIRFYEVETISDALAVLVVVGAWASSFEKRTVLLFPTKFVKSFESRRFKLKIVHKINLEPEADFRKGNPRFEVTKYFEEADGRIKVIKELEMEGILNHAKAKPNGDSADGSFS